ncbi:hypothetical protein CO019_01245 [Candidatus Berkelbacteria bacterium CG_4_9_14_0_2_um_filter_42_30]|uniref:Uncharacterized protein n=5 Tax=Candidatus Berkelbacteria TaxID=1618330 RepID=A0A2M7K1F2_9BACT|nr:MAG: hypothetical protein AUJ40_01360 [Candidatus Berkelbacteria bacterium CG1_02_42_45]PIR27110.1 MAG: hypothetical protein COV40_02650 [Candidatus Berkelbacteria bacterium CG11_big_fil_rev_8_21_14_0_20_42_15]PIX30055.1 MAG: hypothetical protein COZ63_01820 [Candidatus Berkelbacteria bacterium CG_4_8_14_3_um_filter_42_13]PIZ27826.1 MAG: hypothetical protein COY45_00385 [Candidatus Berkelbacteria bacterium CG_4_10_14_0_8_um_filter_42_34]PJC65714.1 MAG: hypothetical protein CO019_01245 [Candi
MEQIINIFAYYDKLIMGVSPVYSGLISLGILLLFAWSLYRFIKGNSIWIILIIVCIPATWPTLKSLARIISIIFAFLITRIKL